MQAAYLAAFEARPTRAEPLVELARWHRERQQHAQAAFVAQWAAAMPRPADRLFVEPAVYDWRALDELAVSGFYARSPELKTAGHAAMRRLMERIDALPDEVRAAAERRQNTRRAPVGLAVDQTVRDRITPLQTVFSLRRHLDCWWVSL